jgi:BlaI family penicillinase repressor
MAAKPPHADLSRRERQIMDVLHRRGEATVAEVMREMPEPPSYSAVRATLRVLEGKEQVVHREDGPRYVYGPALAQEDARSAALKHVVQTFFAGSTEQAVTALLQLSDAKLNPKQIERLAERIRKASEEGR